MIVTTQAFVKKERSKTRHLEKFVKPMKVNRLHRFHKFSLDVSSLIVTTSAFVKKRKVNDEVPKKIRETDGGQIKKQDVPLT